MGKHHDFGRIGEAKAVTFLEARGYEVLERNWRFQRAEIDIIARIDETICIIEVKSRKNDSLRPIALAVDRKKIRLLLTAADAYVTENDISFEVRFDIITVLQKGTRFEIEHLQHAFYYF
ncbi:YraN family protein [Flagellimonas sp. DF-77]|uniref:YraN family protein n=1 Tax=Flagellimonas algarum TaxID=3230298 RepID=UPI0033912000